MNYKKKWMLILLSIIVNILLTGFVANAASLSDHAQYGDHYVDRTPEAPGTITNGSIMRSISIAASPVIVISLVFTIRRSIISCNPYGCENHITFF